MNPLADYLRMFNARPAAATDQDFLARLYASTRDDLKSLTADPAFVASIIGMQQRAQASGYRHSFPDAVYLVLEQEGEPVARIVVNVSSAEMRLVDIAVMPQVRGKGFGSAVLRALQQCAAENKLPLTLAVHHSNPNAKRLYQALGFQSRSFDEMSEQMIWNKAAA